MVCARFGTSEEVVFIAAPETFDKYHTDCISPYNYEYNQQFKLTGTPNGLQKSTRTVFRSVPFRLHYTTKWDKRNGKKKYYRIDIQHAMVDI